MVMGRKEREGMMFVIYVIRFSCNYRIRHCSCAYLEGTRILKFVKKKTPR